MSFQFPEWDKIVEVFERLPLIAVIIRWMKGNSLPGFFKVPVWDVAAFVWKETQQDSLITRANATAFSFFLSLFPAIIFLFTVATLTPLYSAFEQEINGYIDHIMPTNAGGELKTTIKALVKPNTSVLSLGFVLTLYFSSNGMMQVMEGFEKTHLKVFKQRSALRKRLIAIALTLQLGVLLASSVVLIIMGNFLIGWVADFFDLTSAGEVLIGAFRWLMILLLFYSGVSIIYRYGAPMHRKFRWITPGATLATLLSIVSSLAFSFYVEAFDTYNKVYGSIGTIMVLMLWIQINCFILMVGFELNASIAVHEDLRKAVEQEC